MVMSISSEGCCCIQLDYDIKQFSSSVPVFQTNILAQSGYMKHFQSEDVGSKFLQNIGTLSVKWKWYCVPVNDNVGSVM